MDSGLRPRLWRSEWLCGPGVDFGRFLSSFSHAGGGLEEDGWWRGVTRRRGPGVRLL